MLLVLDSTQTSQKIKRMAYQIFEQNYLESEIVIAGIFDKGYQLAELLKEELSIHYSGKTSLIKVSLDKFSPLQSSIELSCDVIEIKNKVIILVDDVLNSGRTLAYSLKPFLTTEVKKLQTAVLVDRGHKSFPISPDYTGYSLSTTLKEHIEVVFENKKVMVYLK